MTASPSILGEPHQDVRASFLWQRRGGADVLGVGMKRVDAGECVERETGFEPATLSLGS